VPLKDVFADLARSRIAKHRQALAASNRRDFLVLAGFPRELYGAETRKEWTLVNISDALPDEKGARTGLSPYVRRTPEQVSNLNVVILGVTAIPTAAPVKCPQVKAFALRFIT
jgi:hypothetical protein